MSKQTARPPGRASGGRTPRTFGGVLEAAIDDRAQELGLEQEIAEAGGVDADVALLDSGIATLGAGVGGRLLLFLVVEELLFLLGLFLVVGHVHKKGVDEINRACGAVSCGRRDRGASDRPEDPDATEEKSHSGRSHVCLFLDRCSPKGSDFRPVFWSSIVEIDRPRLFDRKSRSFSVLGTT